MSKSYYSLGLMSGTSMDGVDASIIQSDGETKYEVILDKYYKYSGSIYKDLTNLRDRIKTSKDLKKFSKEAIDIEKKITLFHVNAVKEIIKKSKVNVDFIGFHGQTIFHNAEEKITKQLGDGKLLSKLTKKKVVYDFRQNDLKNGGHGAPLTPIFHKLLVKQNKIPLPVVILNIGGVANITSIDKKEKINSYDIGPGNCMIDEWIRLNSKNRIKYDKDGKIARSGKTNAKILKKLVKKYKEIYNGKDQILKSFDTKDFDLSFVKGLSAKDGAATLTEFTGSLIGGLIYNHIQAKSEINNNFGYWRVLVCGGGRKNKTLMENIDKKFPIGKYYLRNDQHVKTCIPPEASPVESIDIFNINGDFVESQAFAYLAIRSHLKLPISFPETTGVKKPCTGGKIIKN